MLDATADWTIGQLNGEQAGSGGDAILIVDEASDEKSSAAANQPAENWSISASSANVGGVEADRGHL